MSRNSIVGRAYRLVSRARPFPLSGPQVRAAWRSSKPASHFATAFAYVGAGGPRPRPPLLTAGPVSRRGLLSGSYPIDIMQPNGSHHEND
jgi:hypothetical protein